MRKFFKWFWPWAVLAGLLLSFPSESHAVPLDVPYGILYDTVTFTTANVPIVFSTTTLPTTNANYYQPINNATSQWCLDYLLISSPSAGVFTLYNSTGSLTAGTTDYWTNVPATTAFNGNFSYRIPHCAPRGNQWDMQFTVSGATITYEIYSFKGWNP